MRMPHDALVHQGSVFACGFLQPTPRDARLAVQLVVPSVRPTGDFNPQVSAPCRAHTKKRARPKSRPQIFIRAVALSLVGSL